LHNLVAALAILAGLVLNKDTVERILRSNLMRNSVIYQEILQEGRLQGRLEAKLEGKLEAKKEIALNLLRMGFSLEQVVQATGLRVEEIPSL
jgi:predicted transposase/invertase (TIGR01784 family)